MITVIEIENKIQTLREEYKNPVTTDERKETLKLMARALKIARDKIEKS